MSAQLRVSGLLCFPTSLQFIDGRNTPETNKKEKSLSHPVAHSLDSPRADSHLREARPQGSVLASWQVPSVKQGLYVLAVCVLALGHISGYVSMHVFVDDFAYVLVSICASLPCYASVYSI